MRCALAVLLAAAAAAVAAAGAGARSGTCEAAGTVCLGTLPSSHARVVLKSVGGSGERGVAAIVLGLHETKVVFRLRGAPAGVRQTVQILLGGCRGTVLSHLGSIVDGRGTRRAGPISHLSGYAIAVRATSRGSALVACGSVPRRR